MNARLRGDHRRLRPPTAFSIDEHSHDAQIEAYRWLQSQPGIWSWMP